MRSGSFARAGGGPIPAADPVPGVQWQQVWFAALRRPWSSLALIPSHPGSSALFVAEALAAVGRLHGQRPARLLDAEGVDLPNVGDVLRSLAAITGREELAVVAVGCPIDKAASIPIARTADAALLVVPLGEGRFEEARRAIDLVGREHFMGAVTLELGRRR
jgi:hypothetical protein